MRNLHDQVTEKQVDNFFRNVLDKLGIKTYLCQKLKARGVATITILDPNKARQFIKMHGQTQPGAKGFAFVPSKLFHMGRPINCSISNNTPDEFLLRSLKKEESDRYVAASQSKKPKLVSGKVDENHRPGNHHDRRAFDISSLYCGQWDYAGTNLVFVTYSQERKRGRMIFGPRNLLIKLWPQTPTLPIQQVDIPYSSVQSMTIGPNTNPSITFSLAESPKLFESLDTGAKTLETALKNLLVPKGRQAFTRERITALGKEHEAVVSSCLCYRIMLSNGADVAGIRALRRFPEIPESFPWDTSAVMKTAFAAQMAALHSALGSSKYVSLPFDLKFQTQKLAQNGYLGPAKVIELLPVVSRHAKERDISIVTLSVRNLCAQIPFAGPATEASELSLNTLTQMLIDNQESIIGGETYQPNLADQYDHIASVHKVMVTPTGIYLYGPEPEVKNRVLRKYSDFPNYFVSVSFLDEDGEPLRLDRQTSGEVIYHGRFKKVLQGAITIVGREFEVRKLCSRECSAFISSLQFLGFSHSSLRSQTCWYMAPFTLNGSIKHAKAVIEDLGDFRLIRSPAKCAARIGQAFSQTFSSIHIPLDAIRIIPDVERNGRTFSDGVGTCSSEVLRKIWREYPQARGLRPTIYQVRFMGKADLKVSCDAPKLKCPFVQ